MLDQLREFLNNKLKQCEGIYDRYRLQLIKSEAFGACNFCLTITKDNDVVELWEEYRIKFDNYMEGF